MKTATAVAIAMLLLTARTVGVGQSPQRETPVTPTFGTASIAGTVVTDESPPQPVRRAVVTLTGDGLRPSRSAITDHQGRFAIGRLPAGRFTVTVAKASFVTSLYGATRPGRPGTSIAVADGQSISNLAVRIWRGAVISGVLRDDTGGAVEGVPVSAIPARVPKGNRALTLSNNGAVTNDRGEYRIYGLEPGTYVVSAKPAMQSGGALTSMTDQQVEAALEALKRRQPGQPRVDTGLRGATGQTIDFAPVYYPGTVAIAQATPVSLLAGQELTSVDFALLRVGAVTVSGTVTRPSGEPAANAAVQLTMKQTSGAFAPPLAVELAARTEHDGRFRIDRVGPGTYQLVARAAADPSSQPNSGPNAPIIGMAPGPQLWASTEVIVGATNTGPLTLALGPGPRLSGRVRFDGNAQPPNLADMRVMLYPQFAEPPKPGTIPTTIAVTPAVAVRADGTFEIPSVPPGVFQLTVTAANLDGTWWPRSAMLGSRDLFDLPLDTSTLSPANNIAVAFSDRRSELAGRLVTGDGRPVSSVYVIAFAADPAWWGPSARRTQAVRPGVDGRYALTGLPPGGYLVAVVTEVEPDEWHDSTFLQQLVPSSLNVTISDGERKIQDLKLGAF